MTDLREEADKAQQLVEQIRPILAGQGEMAQSAALADLVSMWLSGMFIVGDARATAELRHACLMNFVETVKQLTPVNEAMITKPMLERLKQ